LWISLLFTAALRLTVGAAKLQTGEMRYFDRRDTKLTARHVMASGERCRKGVRSQWTADCGDARRMLADAPWEAEVDPIEGFYFHECRPRASGLI